MPSAASRPSSSRFPEQASIDGDDRRVRERHVDNGRTAPDDHANAELLARRGQLGDEPALADAGFTADHDRLGVARRAPCDRRPEQLQLTSRPTITGLEILRAMTPIIRIVLACAACSGGRPGQCSATCTRGDRQRAKPKVRRVVVSGSAMATASGVAACARVCLAASAWNSWSARFASWRREAAVEVLHRVPPFVSVRPVRCWRPGRYRR